MPGCLTKVLTKVAFWNPSINFANTLESLPEDMYLAVLEERIQPIISCVDGVKRVAPGLDTPFLLAIASSCPRQFILS